MVHKTRRDRIHDKIRETLKVEKIKNIEKNRLKWFGHLKRMMKRRLPERMLKLNVQENDQEEDNGKNGSTQVEKNLQERGYD